MSRKLFQILYWLPRVLAILFIAFISLFALDSFAEDYKWYQVLVGFLIHLIPTYLLIGVLWVAWRREELGGLLFVFMGALSMVVFHPPVWTMGLIIAGPVILIGILFITSGRAK